MLVYDLKSVQALEMKFVAPIPEQMHLAKWPIEGAT